MSRSPGLRKFDGRRLRGLYSHEIAQIAGRAGRFRKDGAFGVTGDAPDLDPDVVGRGRGPCLSPGHGRGMAQRAARFPVAVRG